MFKIFLIQVTFYKLFGFYFKVRYGTNKLSDKFTTTILSISTEKKYWYEGNLSSHLVTLNKNKSEDQIEVLILTLPFSKDKVKTGDFFFKRTKNKNQTKRAFSIRIF